MASSEYLGTDFFDSEIFGYLRSEEYSAWAAQQQTSGFTPEYDFDSGEYWSGSVSGFIPFIPVFGMKFIMDDYGQVFVSPHFTSFPGFSVMRGQEYVNRNTQPKDFESVSTFDVEQQPHLSEEILSGWSGGASGGFWAGVSAGLSSGPKAHLTTEGGLYSPGFAFEFGYTFKIWPPGTN